MNHLNRNKNKKWKSIYSKPWQLSEAMLSRSSWTGTWIGYGNILMALISTLCNLLIVIAFLFRDSYFYWCYHLLLRCFFQKVLNFAEESPIFFNLDLSVNFCQKKRFIPILKFFPKHLQTFDLSHKTTQPELI